ncbi:MAG: hypothetical protein ACFFA6_12220 [Promethearchaeota archaeon]
MSYKEKIIKQLRKGYLPLGVSPKEDLNTIFNKIFKPLTDRKDLDLFFELAESDEERLRAWGFLGIYYILKDKKFIDTEKEIRLHKVIITLLNDNSEIKYYGGSSEIESSIREHHIRRLCELDTSLIFKPVYEYIESFKGKTDEVIGELLENLLSRSEDPRVIPLILRHAKSISQEDYNLKTHIIRSLENLGKNLILKVKHSITELFREYLEDNEKYKAKMKNESGIPKIKKLEQDILKTAAVLDLDLEKETLEFLNKLTNPFKDLPQIAEGYKNNEKFRSVLLNKLRETENPHLIKDLLMAIIKMKENVQNWKDLIIEYLNKFELADSDLIEELQKVDLLNEEMLVNFLNKGDTWQLEFIREFLISNPEKLNIWSKFKNKFIEILEFFKNPQETWEKYPNLKEKKELALKIIIDLEREDLIKYCLDNVIGLEDNNLREIALFAIIRLGNEQIMLELKNKMKENKEVAEFFKKFWRYLERREFKFYY